MKSTQTISAYGSPDGPHIEGDTTGWPPCPQRSYCPRPVDVTVRDDLHALRRDAREIEESLDCLSTRLAEAQGWRYGRPTRRCDHRSRWRPGLWARGDHRARSLITRIALEHRRRRPPASKRRWRRPPVMSHRAPEVPASIGLERSPPGAIQLIESRAQDRLRPASTNVASQFVPSTLRTPQTDARSWRHGPDRCVSRYLAAEPQLAPVRLSSPVIARRQRLFDTLRRSARSVHGAPPHGDPGQQQTGQTARRTVLLDTAYPPDSALHAFFSFADAAAPTSAKSFRC